MRRADPTRQSRVAHARSGCVSAAWAAVAVIAGGLLISGCAEQITKHGHHFNENDLQSVQPGMSQEQVRMSLGSPATTATVASGNAFYYISSTMKQSSFFTPVETDRQVVAVYFSPVGSVERVANYGLKDGKVFDLIKRTTPAPGTQEEGLLKQLFRNLGRKQNIFGDG
ncbi:MAG: cell envelope protein SmpA [Hyphomicrobium sp.]|nr:MAG: cell envelope protein SmpA [Hyphomicrobium sp.]